MWLCVVGGAGESARSFGRISAAVSQTVYGNPGGAGTENERKVRDENLLHLSVVIKKINICHVIPNLFGILLWNAQGEILIHVHGHFFLCGYNEWVLKL